ncbi:MAG TPA: hypothetical protein VFD84_04690 [Candidatus Binatia bacterium]|jgi:hypothetical protein|nr:hypothetical protein [Candidatus Binatia bacterium]
MRIVMTVLLAAGLLSGRPAVAGMNSPGVEAANALAAAGANLVYVPVKAIVALAGVPVGALTGLLTGGSTRAAYAVWVPTASGTWLLTPEHLEGSQPIEFFGTDYADRPSTAPNATGTIYDAVYRSR